MLENKSLDQMIADQISTVVDQRAEDILNSTEWTAALEARIMETIAARINGRFSNVSAVPELVSTVETCVARLFQQGQIPDIGTYVDPKMISAAVDSGIQDLVAETINTLIVDAAWLSRIQQLVDRHMTDRVLQQLSMIDVNSAVVAAVHENFDRWKHELEKVVDSPGITDQAATTQLTVMDDVVVVEHELAAESLSVETTAEVKGDLVVNNLVVRGAVNTDNASWDELANIVSQKALDQATTAWHAELIQSVLTQASTGGIDFASVTISGAPLVAGDQLNPAITKTNISRVGTLEELVVDGVVHFTGGTLNTLRRRVGINTADPEMALSVWDEDVSLLMGRLKEQHGYIGTARSQALSIGVNRKAQIELDTEGLTTIKQLRVGQHRISFGREVPGYSGTRGDIVFNQDPKPDSAFAWQCLGGFKWNPIGIK
jgi:hypothetical protein